MNTLAEFHFLRPLALLLLLALPLFWLAWRQTRGEAGAWRHAVDAHLLPHLLERIDAGAGRGGLALAVAVWVLASVALAGPAWEREPMPLYHNQAARVLALELSHTMYAQDEKPNRLARARFKLDDILSRSRDYQTALIGYAGDAFVAAPLTDDVGTVRNLIDALDPGTMPALGNDMARAIEAGVDLIAQAGLHRGEIVLLADGAGADAEAIAAARKAHARGVTVSVLGIGSAAGAPVPLPQGDFLKDDSGNLVVARLDESAMRAVATAGGGRFAPLSADARDLDALLPDRVEAATDADASGHKAESTRWRDRGPWLLLALLPLAALGFRRGWLMLFVLAIGVQTQQARAASLADLWQRPDQQAARALEQGDVKRAAGVARTPEWRAGAAYRAGDYEAALRDYEQSQGADGIYNKANALAKLGRYDEALAAYDEALKLAPEMADATANRQAVEEFLRQKQQQEQDSPSAKNGSGQDSKQSPQKGKQDQQPNSEDQNGQQGGQGEQSKQQDSQQQQGGQEQPSDSSQEQQGEDKKDKQGSSQEGKAGSGKEEQQQGAQQEQAGKPDAKQQDALSKSIDQALADGPKPGDKDAQAQRAVPAEDDATREKKQALEHWLQRVPDDPGGLLRRKFQLEYQRRQQRGGDQP